MSLDSPRLLDDALFAHFESYKHRLGGSLESFSESMLETIQQLMPGMQGNFFSIDPSVVKRMEANGKKLRRQQDDRTDHRMPVRMLSLFVATMQRLDAAAGAAAATEVCASVGSMYVPIPDTAAGADMARLGRLHSRFGDVILSTAPIVADGAINKADSRPQVATAIEDIYEMVGAALAFAAQLQAVYDAPTAGAQEGAA